MRAELKVIDSQLHMDGSRVADQLQTRDLWDAFCSVQLPCCILLWCLLWCCLQCIVRSVTCCCKCLDICAASRHLSDKGMAVRTGKPLCITLSMPAAVSNYTAAANPGCCVSHMMLRSSCTPSTSLTCPKGSSISTAAHLSD